MPRPREERIPFGTYAGIFTDVFGVSPTGSIKLKCYVDDINTEQVGEFEYRLDLAMGLDLNSTLLTVEHLDMTHTQLFDAFCTYEAAPLPRPVEEDPAGSTYQLAMTQPVLRTCGCSGCSAGTTCLQIG